MSIFIFNFISVRQKNCKRQWRPIPWRKWKWNMTHLIRLSSVLPRWHQFTEVVRWSCVPSAARRTSPNLRVRYAIFVWLALSDREALVCRIWRLPVDCQWSNIYKASELFYKASKFILWRIFRFSISSSLYKAWPRRYTTYSVTFSIHWRIATTPKSKTIDTSSVRATQTAYAAGLIYNSKIHVLGSFLSLGWNGETINCAFGIIPPHVR